MVLKANIPSLSCPPALKSGCKLHLVDNPGLGELNQIASRMAQLAVATSTAYIYTMDCESIELKEHAEIIKILLERDSGESLLLFIQSLSALYCLLLHFTYTCIMASLPIKSIACAL